MTNIKSKCCNAEVKAVCSDDFGDKEDRGGQTCHYECLKCGEACDIQTENTNIIEEFEEIENIVNGNSLADAFIKEYCNDHGKLRWLRGVFFDEDDKMNTIIKWLKFADKKLQQALSQRDKEWEEKIWDMLFESFPSDMENFDLMLPDQAYRLLKTFWEKLKSLNK